MSNLQFLTNRILENRAATSVARKFNRRFPGPYAVTEGTDGVDRTFDVMCMTSGRHIVSTYYWLDCVEAKLVADVIAACLEVRRDREHPLATVSQEQGTHFQWLYPGDIELQEDHCELRGPYLDIRCPMSNGSIVQVYGRDRKARIIANYLALAIERSAALPIPF